MTTRRLGVNLPLCVTLLATTLGAATVKFEVTKLDTSVTGTSAQVVGGGAASLQRYTYYLSDIALLCDQELNIRFDPARFGSLSNGTGSPGFDVLLFQPNQPAGAFGDFSALSTMDQTAKTSSFSVDFIYLGSGVSGPQPYFINQFNANGGFTTLESGFTSPARPADVPEPGTMALCGAVLLVCGAWRASRR